MTRPRTTCFTQALTGQVLLERHGYSARLNVGVVKRGDDRLLAHAWVESNGEVVIGGADLERYNARLIFNAFPPRTGP